MEKSSCNNSSCQAYKTSQQAKWSQSYKRNIFVMCKIYNKQRNTSATLAKIKECSSLECNPDFYKQLKWKDDCVCCFTLNKLAYEFNVLGKQSMTQKAEK